MGEHNDFEVEASIWPKSYSRRYVGTGRIVTLRMKKPLYLKYLKLGGAKWLKEMVDRAELQENPSPEIRLEGTPIGPSKSS
jgi:hypothetical protein